MTDLTALIERVESGTGADRALDLEIVRAIYPFALVLRHNSETGANEPYTHHNPTASVDSVLVLIEAKLPGWAGDVDLGASTKDDGLYGARLFPPDDRTGDRFGFNVTGEASSPARAILAAALRALQESRRHD